MKKLFYFAFAVLAAFSSASCDDEEEGGSNFSDLKYGQAMFNGTVYDVESFLSVNTQQDPAVYASIEAFSMKPEKEEGLNIYFGGEIVNKKIDLAKPQEKTNDMSINVFYRNGEVIIESAEYLMEGKLMSYAGGEEGEGSAFKKGTLNVTYDKKSDTVTAELNGTLKDGTEVGVKLKGQNNR